MKDFLAHARNYACICTHTRSHMQARQCKLVHTCTHLHTCISTRTQRHARTLFLHLDQLGFDQFYKKKFICHCMLISRCSNYILKNTYVNPYKV